MAKGRMLQNRISKSQKLSSLSNDTVRLLYTWMLSHLDINGNFYADPVMVNNLVFTRLGHPPRVIASALDELEKVGLIQRYQCNGDIYLNYPDFEEKQPRLYPEREGNPDIPKLTHELLMNNTEVTQPQIKLKEIKLKEKKCSREGFEEFWKAYPKKVNKKEAQLRYDKIETPLPVLLEAIEKQKNTEQWLKDDGKFIPYPSSWLNQERWNDEIKEVEKRLW